MKLLSKIQYRNHEAGEFTDAKMRTYAETINILETFPWNHERQGIRIGLTNPSITIEGKNNDFLKIGLYYNQKYVLRYFSKINGLYSKSFTDLKNTYECIESFFNELSIELKDFRQEKDSYVKTLQHFESREFIYKLESNKTFSYFLSTNYFGVILVLIVIIISVYYRVDLLSFAILIAMMSFLFIVYGLGELILFMNYYRFAKNKTLIISKANEIFYYGENDNLIEYDKRNISELKIISKYKFMSFVLIKIHFSNKDVIKVPNIIIDEFDLKNKLDKYNYIEIEKFPFIKK